MGSPIEAQGNHDSSLGCHAAQQHIELTVHAREKQRVSRATTVLQYNQFMVDKSSAAAPRGFDKCAARALSERLLMGLMVAAPTPLNIVIHIS